MPCEPNSATAGGASALRYSREEVLDELQAMFRCAQGRRERSCMHQGNTEAVAGALHAYKPPLIVRLPYDTRCAAAGQQPPALLPAAATRAPSCVSGHCPRAWRSRRACASSPSSATSPCSRWASLAAASISCSLVRWSCGCRRPTAPGEACLNGGRRHGQESVCGRGAEGLRGVTVAPAAGASGTEAGCMGAGGQERVGSGEDAVPHGA